MATLSSRGSRRRRAMNEINMVPFIDVMLVLLIIFMVSAPLITTGIIDLPSVGKAQQRPARVIELVIDADQSIRVRLDSADQGTVALAQLAARVRELQAGQDDTPVVISAHRKLEYEVVVRAMDSLQRAGVKRVGLSVRQGAGS